MKKAAIIAPNSLPVPPIRGGGIQNGIAEIIKHYKEYKPYVFSKATYGIDDLPSFEIDGNAEHHRICLSPREDFLIRLRHLSTRSYFPYVHLIAQKLLEIEPDVVHIRSRPWFVPLFRRYLGKKVKIILQNHNNYFAEMSAGQVRRYLAQIDAFAGISRHSVNVEVLDRFPDEKDRCFVIYNGVNAGKFRPGWEDAERRTRLRSEYGLKNDDVVLLFVGRLRKAKGLDTLMRSMKDVVRMNGHAKLVVIGGHFFGGDETVSDFMKFIMKEAEAIKDNVIFTGFMTPEKMPDMYAMADILTVPSHMETFGSVFAEAGAAGLPVVAAKRGGVPEIVDEGETGFLVDDPDDSVQLTDRIMRLVKDAALREKFGRKARETVAGKFNWAESAKKTEEMYNIVLSR